METQAKKPFQLIPDEFAVKFGVDDSLLYVVAIVVLLLILYIVTK